MEANKRAQSTISKISSFFKGNSASKQLLAWKQSDEKEDWAKRAVEVLVKKLKKTPRALMDLEEALKSRSDKSKCVKIPRTIDGRLQISNCKALPHVVYCRVWRWPDLRSHHELRGSKQCLNSFHSREKEICINPYHYERVENSNMPPPILVPRVSEFIPGFSLLPANQVPVAEQMPGNVTYVNNGFGQATNAFPNSPGSSGQNSPQSMISNASSYNSQPYPINRNGNNIMETNDSPPNCHENNGFTQNQPDIMQVHYEEPEYWATVAYYELNQRVGDQFRCNTSSYSLKIDGFTNPSCDTINRFCLGQLSNIHRNSTIESTRKHIGKGVHLYMENQELYLQCLSDAPIFLQSSMTNHLHNFGPGTVCKVMPTYQLKVFDNSEFANMLNQVVHSGFEASFALTKMCTIRISFVKGWGTQYHRQDITATPCWIEIHLNGPLKWLDEVLNKMGSPLNAISSDSDSDSDFTIPSERCISITMHPRLR